MTDTHETTALAPVVQTYIEKPAALHPLVAMAQKQNGEIDVDTLRELMTLQREYESGESKKAFTRAMVALKAEMPSVLSKDKKVGFDSKDKTQRVKYSHTTLGHAITEITPHLAAHGFSLTWSADNTNPNQIKTTCRISHCDGHYEEMTLAASPDNSGNKNSIQAIGSTVTYLQRYSALALLGIATEDMKDCDDESPKESVDISRNLKAIASLAQVGITKEQAEAHVQCEYTKWTSEDLEYLRALKQSRKQISPTEREPGQDG